MIGFGTGRLVGSEFESVMKRFLTILLVAMVVPAVLSAGPTTLSLYTI